MKRRTKFLTRGIPAIGLSGLLVAGLLGPAGASSHREAPAISQDPAADLTDLYAFVSPDKPDTVTLIANVYPFIEPASGPNFARFADDVLYQINVDNNGDSAEDVSFDFRFTTTTQNPNTFLYNTGPVKSLDDPNLNIRQTYSVTERRGGLFGKSTVIAENLPVPPPNIGPRSFPDYDSVAKSAIKSVNGITYFAGPRDDPFFADLGKIFDLGGLGPFNPAHLIPKPAAAGEDYLAGKNVLSIAIQVPKSELVNGDPVIGVWSSTYRRTERVFAGQKMPKGFFPGGWTQVSRLGQPLVNEVVIPLGMKDAFNASHPFNDLQFAKQVLNPELANLIEVLYPGVKVPHQVDAKLGLGGREDIATIFLTGIPGVNQPKNVKPSEELRLNTDSAKSAFPNGRWLADDVLDTELQALAGATAFTPDFNKAPNNQLGDGVDKNDADFTPNFPYVATPWAP